MRPSRYDRVCEIFWQACELAVEERASYLDQECAGDASLRAEVDSMLDADQDSRFQQFTQVGEEMRAQVAVEAAADQSPLRIGPFRILGVLGEGGMGVVYLAQQDRPHRTVALKVLQPNLISERTLARFEHEAEILARLQHPGIARLYEVGTDQSGDRIRPWFAMERVEGTSILEHAEQKKLTLDQRLALFGTVCEAVHHAHLKGVIHRDLKPPNILVDDDGQARVLDFGIARLSEADAEAMALTGDFRQLVGTIPYMSPEQASGEFKDLDARSDVYSLGVILYELISGQLPYKVRDTAILEAVRIVKERDPLPLTATQAHPDEDVDVIVRHALEKEKERRYQSASEMGADIGRYLRREPIHARPPSAWYLLRRFATRHRALVVSMVALFLTLLSATIVSTLLYREAAEANRAFQEVADLELLRDLDQESHQLWPLRERTIQRMGDWIMRAEKTLKRIDFHRARLQDTQQSGLFVEASGEWLFGDHTQRFIYNLQAELVQEMERFLALQGPLARVKQRREIANRVAPRTMVEAGPQWDEAIASIAASDKYEKLKITRQEGLIPLRQDPTTELWEFYLWESGSEPRLDPSTDRWVIESDTSLIFVLLPPGSFLMGASKDPNSPRFDPDAQEVFESPPHEVALDAFFLSKYELTQEQWAKVMDSHPSEYWEEPERAALQPVETITWREARECCRRLSLVLPTEAQWEYACRAGTTTPFYWGKDVSPMPLHENVAGQEIKDALQNLKIALAPWDDGLVIPAPVGTLKANPWGLQDMLGNVAEWCQDGFLSYDEGRARPGDGLRCDEGDRVHRGGDYYQSVTFSRCTTRATYGPDDSSNHLGFRPARPVFP